MVNGGEIFETLKPLIFFVLGMVVYSIFIFKFYLFIAKRDIIEFDLKRFSTRARYDWLKRIIYFILYIVEYIILFPIFISIWFAVFAILLMIMSKDQTLSIVLLIAMAVVSTVRITSYYNEDLSKDLAKMLPFALLGVLLVDISFFSLDSIILSLLQLPGLVFTILYYLLFAIVVEFVLRILALIFKPTTGPEEFKKEDDEEDEE